MIIHQKEKQRERQHWDLYLVQYGKMDKDTYIPFDEFYKRTPKISAKSKEEILEKAKKIRKSLGK